MATGTKKAGGNAAKTSKNNNKKVKYRHLYDIDLNTIRDPTL